MHPELFSFNTPDFLEKLFSFLPDRISVQGYGTMIALGIVAALLFLTQQAKKEGIPPGKIMDLFIWVFIAAFIGGRFFFFFEDPARYFGEPTNMLRFSGSGFVFYGSLLFAIPVMIIFFRLNKMPVLKMLDLMAFTTIIVHAFGRTGCFLAGCCHGSPTESIFGVAFTDPSSHAEPLNVPLHPTQLYSVFMLLLIFAILKIIRKRQVFHGQLFLLYLVLYAFGRSIVEIFRGDEARGFIFNSGISHSQAISIMVGICGLIVYFFALRRNKKRAERLLA